MQRLVFFLIGIICSASFAAETKDAIQFYTHSASHAISNNDKGEIVAIPHMGRRAIDIEIIRWIMKDLNLPNNLKNYPFKRAYQLVQTQQNVALFNVLRTPERESTVQWVGPLNKYTSFFYEAVNNPSNIRTINDAKSAKSVCVLAGNVHHSALARMGFENLVLGDTYTQCANLLLKGRVSLMPAGENPRFVNRDGFSGAIQRTAVAITTRRGYLAVSLDVPKQTVKKLQDSFDKLKSSEDYQMILETYSEKNND